MNKVKLKQHNQETYDNLLNMLKTENRVACVKPSHDCVFKKINLGRWFYRQMMFYKNMPELFMTSNEYRWIQMFSILKEYVDTYDKFPDRNTIYNTVKLGLWYYRQFYYFQNNLLSKDHQIKLESIGVVFDDNKKEQKN